MGGPTGPYQHDTARVCEVWDLKETLSNILGIPRHHFWFAGPHLSPFMLVWQFPSACPCRAVYSCFVWKPIAACFKVINQFCTLLYRSILVSWSPLYALLAKTCCKPSASSYLIPCTHTARSISYYCRCKGIVPWFRWVILNSHYVGSKRFVYSQCWFSCLMNFYNSLPLQVKEGAGRGSPVQPTTAKLTHLKRVCFTVMCTSIPCVVIEITL